MVIPPVQMDADAEVQNYNRPIDAPTMFVEAIGSMVADGSVMKIGFIEILPTLGQGQQGRFVVNLAMPRTSVKQLRDTLDSLIQDIERYEAAASDARV